MKTPADTDTNILNMKQDPINPNIQNYMIDQNDLERLTLKPVAESAKTEALTESLVSCDIPL